MPVTLGTLKKLNPKEVWHHEASEFTPWLRQNLHLLAEVLGLELDLVEQEAPMGDFSADLVGKDLNSGQWVIIENQLAQTDHSHLGQILTYAANRSAGVVVWISPKFRDEHRQALEWLNQVTDENTSFFGLEIELLQIDDSSPAPEFTIVAKPSEWLKHKAGTVGHTAKQQAYHDFYDKLLQQLKAEIPGITTANHVGYQSWIGLSAGRSGFQYSFAFGSGKRFRIELYIDQGDKQKNKEAFRLLNALHSTIDEELGARLTWEPLEDKQACRISLYYDEPCEVSDAEEKLMAARKWAVETIPRFREAFSPRVKLLRL